jgi:hypothetical protein
VFLLPEGGVVYIIIAAELGIESRQDKGSSFFGVFYSAGPLTFMKTVIISSFRRLTSSSSAIFFSKYLARSWNRFLKISFGRNLVAG